MNDKHAVGDAGGRGYEVRDRRPMGPREWRVSQWVTRRLVEWNISPNAISLAGVVFAVLGGAAWVMTRYVDGPWAVRPLWLAGVVGIELRAACNLLDGMVAVAKGRASAVGELYNEVPDRMSDVAMLVGLGYAVTAEPTLGWAAAVAAVGVAYVRAQVAAAGAGQDYGGPMAKPMRMQICAVAGLWYTFTPGAWWVVGGVSVSDVTLVVIIAGCFITAALRLCRAARRLRG